MTERSALTEDEILAIQRLRWPAMAQQETDADARLRDVLRSGDPRRVSEGAHALADWIDARAAMVVYFRVWDRTDVESR